MPDLPQASSVAQKRRIELGIEVPPIDNDEWANCCMLYWLLSSERKREFWSLDGDRATKQAFLLRHGHFEQWRKPV